MARTGYYKKPVYYSVDFVNEMELFMRNIAIDKRFDALKQKYRFSAVIRIWIRSYNKKFAEETKSN